MSLVIGAKTEEYGVLVSDSRTINEKQEVLREDFKKIFAYENAIAAFTGRNNFQDGIIQDIIGNIVHGRNDIDKISQSINEISNTLQKQLKENEWVNFHIIQASDGQLIYRVIDFGKYNYYVNEVFAGDIRHSGISLHNTEDLTIGNDYKQTAEIFARKIKREAKRNHLINDRIQMMAISKDGKILSY